MKRLIAFALLLLPSLAVAGGAIDAERVAGASGWKTQRLDMDITIAPDDSFLTVEGRIVLALEEGPAREAAFLMNSRRPEMVLEELRVVSCDGIDPEKIEIDDGFQFADLEHMLVAVARFPREVDVGQEIELAFSYRSDGQSRQVLVGDEFAYASWVEAWYPTPVDDSDPEDPHTGIKARARGKTTFHIPTGWWALSNGARTERRDSGDGVVEVWEDDFGTARSFVTAPFMEPEEVKVGDRTIAVYLLSPKPLEAQVQAQRLSEAIGVLADCFGPYPYATFAIAEVPNNVESFGAASEQGFIVARTNFFDAPDGNLPLFAHEAGHTWWGNLVSSSGAGHYMCSESFAQFGAVLAIDAVEGREAALDFLEFSRASYVPNQCARAYFAYVRLGVDRPMSALDNTTRFDHTLSDAKGHWVYHMLRHAIGDSLFFDTCRRIVSRYTEEQITLDKLRGEFIAAAPNIDLEQFFAQWLDRTGAPVIDLRWQLEKQMKDNPYVDFQLESVIIGEEEPPFEVTLELEQVQAGEPYVLDLEVEVEFVDGSTQLESVHMDTRQAKTTLSVDALPREIRLDPNRKTLLWRPVYGPRPDAEVVSAGTPAQ